MMDRGLSMRHLPGSAEPFDTRTINAGGGNDEVAVGSGDSLMDLGKAANDGIDLGSGSNIFDGGGLSGSQRVWGERCLPDV
jgi:hypothetical protein